MSDEQAGAENVMVRQAHHDENEEFRNCLIYYLSKNGGSGYNVNYFH